MTDEQGPLSPDERSLLLLVAERGGLGGPVSTSSLEVADELGVSQQTASRWILELVDAGLIDRDLGSRGQRLQLTQEGVDLLAEELDRLERIFEKGSSMRFEGVVSEGDGEGAYYMSQPFYKEGFQKLLGFEPFPGTLNLVLDGEDLDAMRGLRSRRGLEIPKVETDERTFGGVTGFPARVQGSKAGVIFPHRTRHEDVLEVISPVRLRDELDLENGDVLTVEVDADPPRKTYQPRPGLLS